MEPLSEFCLEAMRCRDKSGELDHYTSDRRQLLQEVDRLQRELQHTHGNLMMARQCGEMMASQIESLTHELEAGKGVNVT